MAREVSVIIPTFNYGEYIADAVRSTLSQTVAPKEILVVDDGSTDDIRSIVEPIDRAVRYIHQENAGVSAARNRGAKESTGDILIFLDSDDTLEPTFIERQIEKLFDQPGVGLVHCGMREFDSRSGATINLHLVGGEDDLADNLLLWEGPVYVHGITVTREAFNAVGGFDEAIRVASSEDWDFCYRVARRFRVGFVADALYNYRIHSEGAHHNVDKLAYGMSAFYSKAFDTKRPEILALKRRAIGNFHKVLSGSYYSAGQYGKFAKHFFLSIFKDPTNIHYFLTRFISRRPS